MRRDKVKGGREAISFGQQRIRPQTLHSRRPTLLAYGCSSPRQQESFPTLVAEKCFRKNKNLFDMIGSGNQTHQAPPSGRFHPDGKSRRRAAVRLPTPRQRPAAKTMAISFFDSIFRLCAHVLTTLQLWSKAVFFRTASCLEGRTAHSHNIVSTTCQHVRKTFKYWSLDDHAYDLGE